MTFRTRIRHILMALAPLAIMAGTFTVTAQPAHATGYCVGVYPQPGTGAYVCTPWR